jgi:hypothetical protein
MTVHTSYWSKPKKVTHTGEISIQGLQILQVSVAGEIANVLLKPVSTARSFGKTGGIWIEHRALGEFIRAPLNCEQAEITVTS